ncbi:MAG: zinc ribbon domain-containing protein [Planctomycetes bacterium]|nr:zinc ribbon domain-containing protein [Planctomycetota bacterium]
MAMASCPECHGEISDQANSCPHCGYPLKDFGARFRGHFIKKSKRLSIIAICFLLFGTFLALISNSTGSAKFAGSMIFCGLFLFVMMLICIIREKF